jgi:hypothetical protein
VRIGCGADEAELRALAGPRRAAARTMLLDTAVERGRPASWRSGRASVQWKQFDVAAVEGERRIGAAVAQYQAYAIC